jgi:hypothetical protein
LIVGVVDLDIGLVAHFNSGSYRESTNTPERKITFKHGIDAQTIMMT